MDTGRRNITIDNSQGRSQRNKRNRKNRNKDRKKRKRRCQKEGKSQNT